MTSNEGFGMTVLALRTAGRANGVSALHGRVSRRMWQRVWPGVPENEVPIGHITNGIHTASWFSSEIARLYDRYLGPRWFEEPTDHRVWERVDRIPDSELWRSQERMRERLVSLRPAAACAPRSSAAGRTAPPTSSRARCWIPRC